MILTVMDPEVDLNELRARLRLMIRLSIPMSQFLEDVEPDDVVADPVGPARHYLLLNLQMQRFMQAILSEENDAMVVEMTCCQ